jgi:hypothetical protein
MNSVTVTLSEGMEFGWGGRGEGLTTCDGVAGDALPSEPTAHGAREVMETGLAGAVGVGFMVWDHDSFD